VTRRRSSTRASGRSFKTAGGTDLDPEGGDKGGEIVAEGTPEQVAREPRSYTGHYLRPLLESHAPEVVDAPKPKRGRAAAVREREAAE
jgi:excinuclease ABC subunit A